MIGDTLGVGYFFVVESAVGKGRIAGNVPIGDSTVKIGDDTSPLPVDRVFFDYNHFHNRFAHGQWPRYLAESIHVRFGENVFRRHDFVELKAPLDGG